jgi:hypothetical protein
MRTRVGLALLVAAAFIPVLALATTASGGKPSGTAAGLLPDLRAAVPHHFTVQNTQQHEFLRFSNLVANTGQGDLRLRPEHNAATGITTGFQEVFDSSGNLVVDQPVSTFVFHPEHNHWHIGDTALFEVRKGSPTGTIVGGNSIKTTFCLIDAYKLVGNQPTRDRLFWDCYSSYQGIAPGWVDQYHHSTPGQQLDLTDVPNGDDYYLVSTSNFAGVFTESNPNNNMAWTKFRLYTDSNGNRKVEIKGHSPCVMGSGMCGENATNR